MNVQLHAPPGYGAVAPFDKVKHAGLGVKPDRNYAWCGALNAVYVGIAEFPRAALDYPIALARAPDTGALLPLAVLGFKAGQNLFVDARGRWQAHAYVPAYARRHPFCVADVAAAGGEPERQVICVQEDQLVPGAKPLFGANGEPTADWAPIQQLIDTIEGARRQTVGVLRELEALELVVAFDALALPRGGAQIRLQGMLRVDEARLQKLPGKDLRGLAARGVLRAIYAHLVSLENFARLLDMAHAQESHGN